MLDVVVLKSVVAGLLASAACALGALPLLIPRLDVKRHTGLGYAFAGGLMFSASVYNLILPGLTLGTHEVSAAQVVPVVVGVLLGSLALWAVDRALPHGHDEPDHWRAWGGKAGVLIFLAMSAHSVPEGVAVGVGYASEPVYAGHLGDYIAIAIAIHNIPEGLAVAIPMRVAGASIGRCALAAFLTSLPQPIAAIPASVVSWFFKPLMPVLMGFAAGAMNYLVLLEMIPGSLDSIRPRAMAWAFTIGFCAMILLQVTLSA